METKRCDLEVKERVSLVNEKDKNAKEDKAQLKKEKAMRSGPSERRMAKSSGDGGNEEENGDEGNEEETSGNEDNEEGMKGGTKISGKDVMRAERGGKGNDSGNGGKGAKPLESAEDRNQSAVKSGGAAVPTYMWHQNLFRGLQDMASASPFAQGLISTDEFEVKAATICDRFLLPCWRKLLLRSFVTYLRHDKEVPPGTPRAWVTWNADNRKFEWTNLGQARYVDQWQQDRAKAGVDLEAAVDCLQRGADATWWEWKGGSRPFFWRWSQDRLGGNGYEREMRDGMKVLHDPLALPSYKRAQGPPRNRLDRAKVSDKLKKFMD